ncbi:MAG: hypothetical protein JSS35_15170 [Proteobacteria bacterium]|nr:hypothetical protein [Pseudomonadota bacterium]
MTFAITFAVLAPMSLGIFDIFTMTQQQGKLQDALDAAALYAARSTATTTADINTIGNKALGANLQLVPGATLKSSSFTLVTVPGGDTKVTGTAQVSLPAYAPTEFTHAPITVNTEVTRPGNNLEVSLVLDNTGSMSGSPLTSLKSAANQLIDLVVSDQQSPYYSKMAIVPYSNAVNAGTYATAARGAVLSSTDVNCKNGANKLGCPSYTFTSATGSSRTYSVSTCVSERTGAEAFTDAAPTTSLVGFVYPPPSSAGNNCISATIQPLTSDKTALHNTITSLTANGSTAGEIGLAWGWYMISPNWTGVWPSGSQPASYGTDKLIKAVILMTDGAFNTAYCKGVIAKDSGSGSGNDSDHIGCNATDGDAFTQAQTLCANMKALPHPIVIYTVGFNVGSDPQAQAILSQCATDAAHVYFPSSGSSLATAFQSIAADLNKLRISK